MYPNYTRKQTRKSTPPIPCLPAKVITPLYENVLIKNQISYRHKINYSSGHKNGVLIYYCCFRRLKEQAFVWLLQKLSNRPYFLMEKKNVESFTINMFIVKKNECRYTLFFISNPFFRGEWNVSYVKSTKLYSFDTKHISYKKSVCNYQFVISCI